MIKRKYDISPSKCMHFVCCIVEIRISASLLKSCVASSSIFHGIMKELTEATQFKIEHDLDVLHCGVERILALLLALSPHFLLFLCSADS